MEIKKITTTIRKYHPLWVYLPGPTDHPRFIWGKFLSTRKKLGLSYKQFGKCFWCGRKFNEDEDIYLCGIKETTNVFLCKECAGKINTQLKDENNSDKINK